MVLHGYEICRANIPTYLTPNAVAAIGIWRTYRTFGLPFAGGWAEQPGVYMDVIELLEAEWAKREQEQRENEHGRRK